MDLFRVGEALLRSPQPFLPFLAPSAARPQSRRAIDALSRHCRPSRHAFSTSSTNHVEDHRDPPSSERQPRSSDISSLLDSALDGTKGTPSALATRTSHFKSNTVQAGAPPSRLTGQDLPQKGDSVSELLDSMRSPRTLRPQQPSSRRASDSSFSEISAILDGPGSYSPSKTNSPFSRNNLSPQPTPLLIEKFLPMKLNASVGRTVTIDNVRGMDIGRAFRTLDTQCNKNSVKRDFMRQRFHERPGLKRKRLKGERWRRRFKENFKGVVGLVKSMTAQGW